MRSIPSTVALMLAAILVAIPLAVAGRADARAAPLAADSNPYLWLAQIHGGKALAWVRSQNARSDQALKTDPTYARDSSQILDVLNASTRIPEAMLEHGWVLNFWQSADHVRGIWQRTTIADYARKSPHWRTLLDVDALDRQLHKDWVWKGADCTSKFDRCLVRLSPGGGDALETREYDPPDTQFPGGRLRAAGRQGRSCLSQSRYRTRRDRLRAGYDDSVLLSADREAVAAR